jgi:hypothetical protein
MSLRRLGALTACVLAFVLMIGVIPAGANGSTRVLKLLVNYVEVTGVGFNVNSNAIPPVGSTEVFTGILFNNASQFGKPDGRRVGRVLLDCVVLTETPDGVCTGIAHVPDGFFTLVGNGPFTKYWVRHYAITGGIGPYANERGEFTVTNHPRTVASVLVTLSS